MYLFLLCTFYQRTEIAVDTVGRLQYPRVGLHYGDLPGKICVQGDSGRRSVDAGKGIAEGDKLGFDT